MQSTITPDSSHPFWQIIRVVPDFPKPGIAFYDITPLLRAHVNAVIDALLAAIPQPVFDAVDCLQVFKTDSLSDATRPPSSGH